jgi:hypothetical protein
MRIAQMELADPSKSWRVEGAFFTRQYDMDVTMKWREGIDRSQIVS